MNIGKESETIEFKKSTSEIKEAVISLTSILNKHGKGTIYFGVRDDGEVVGQTIGKDTLRYVSRDIAGNVSPACWYEVAERCSAEGVHFIEVQFSGRQAPYAAYGRYYQRFADQDRAISQIELEQLFRLRQRDHAAWERACSDTPAADVDELLLHELLQRGAEAQRLPSNAYDSRQALAKLGLLFDEGMLNNAGKMLFSGRMPIVLKEATFAGTTKETFLRLKHFEGNIFGCIDEALAYVREAIFWRVSMEGAVRREEPEIPLVALREIIINAFAHGDYEGNTTFEIDIFKDRVTIFSPGFFPLGFVPEDFAERAEEPVMLNPKIVNVLFKVGEIESFGSGFSRAFAACRAMGIEYKYENTRSGFRFTFFRSLGQANVQEDKEMSKTQSLVFKEIQQNNMTTAKTIALKIGKSEKTVYRAIQFLKGKGLIERVGSDYNGSWKVH